MEAAGFEGFVEIVGLEEAVIGSGTGGEPGVGFGGGDNPALPEAVFQCVGGGAGGACGRGIGGFGGVEARGFIGLDAGGQRLGGGGAEEGVAAGEEAIVLLIGAAGAGDPFTLIGFADGAPDHHAVGHIGGDDFGVHGAGADEGRGAEGEEGELLIDLALVLTV